MKSKRINILIALLIITLAATAALAQGKRKRDVRSDIDRLGGNEALVERAKLLDPNNKIRVVQKRSVDRYNRIEASFIGGLVGGGDSYMNTQNLGGSLQYHFSPRISLGVSYAKHYNELTNEGKTVFEEARRRNDLGLRYEVPDIDFPISTTMAFINFYPIYGKLNFFNLGVSQFDIYVSAGYGRVELSSGSTDTYSAGLGTGVWWTQNLTTRLEGRYQTYQDKVYTGSRKLDLLIFNASVGVML